MQPAGWRVGMLGLPEKMRRPAAADKAPKAKKAKGEKGVLAPTDFERGAEIARALSKTDAKIESENGDADMDAESSTLDNPKDGMRDAQKAMARMVNALRYNIESGKDLGKKSQASLALQTYQAINGNNEAAQQQRRNFLSEFQSNNHGKGKDGLKWVVKYQKTAEHTDKKEVASTENFFTRFLV